MLHTQTVTPATLELLGQLMRMPELGSFALVGGTNLSLQLGHRISVDIDLFSDKQFDMASVKHALRQQFPDSIRMDEMKQTIWYSINGVKTDFVLHEYDYIDPVQTVQEIRLASIPDIIAMKLGAVSGRGAKKDFWDIAELLSTYTIKEMLEFYHKKYRTDDIGLVVRSLVYFDDAEGQTDPVSLKKTTWEDVKKKIVVAVDTYIKNETK